MPRPITLHSPALLLSFVLAAQLAGACGSELVQGQNPVIETYPRAQLSFGQVAEGTSETRELVITNEGDATLELVTVVWEGTSAVQLGFPEGPADGLRLAPGELFRLQATYSPSAEEPSGVGDIVIRSNDPQRAELRVAVLTQELAARIQVSPSATEGVDFGQVDRGGSARRTVTLSNVGQLPLEIEAIELNTSADFSLLLPVGLTLPTTLPDASASLELELVYRPETVGEDEGTLLIRSNDPLEPNYELPLRANASAPCIRLDPAVLEFAPPVGIGNSRTAVVTIESCGTVPLELEGLVRLEGNDTELFVAEPTPLAGLELAPDESVGFEVVYAPLDEGVDTAVLAVRSNDPLRPEVRLDVLATGTTNQCPTADLRGRVAGSGVLSEQVAAIPLDTLVLDGTRSSDPESAIAEWRWTVTARPDGSTSALVDEGDGLARLFLDLAGDYEVCLEVVDALGNPSCNRDCVQARARPNEKLHVQLIWTTGADPIVGDADGADLDLHFVRLPYGSWGDTGDELTRNGWDVFFLNREPNWLVPDGVVEHPSLDRDDTDGEGPENVNLDDPNPCAWFAVGVHYFDDKGFGTSYATLRIYVNGQKRFEKLNLPLELGGVAAGDFWYVALVHWDGSTARAFDIGERSWGGAWVGTTPAIPPSALEAIAQVAPACVE